MKALLRILAISSLALTGCNLLKPDSSSSLEPSSHSGDSNTGSSTEPMALVTTTYKNPLTFYKVDGNPYDVSTCDPDVIQGDDGYWDSAV